MPEAELETRAGDPAPADVLCQAIARKMCVTAVYNNKVMKLAPHIVYTKHDAPFVDAVTIEQEGKKPKITKVGTFKLSGLTNIAMTKSLFVAQRTFNAEDPKYAGTTVCAIRSPS